MVHRLNQHSLSPLDAWCICLCSQPHICQCLWCIALHINVCFTCHYVHVQSPRIIFCQQIYYVQQCRCFFCISCATWLDSIGSNGISMIQKSVNLYFGKYTLEIGIEQNLAVLGAEWEQNGKQNHPKSRALSAEVYT